MKQFFIIFSLLLLCVIKGWAQEITFAETVYDFGEKLEKDGAFYHDFQFTNTGNQALIIKSVNPGPGCSLSGWKPAYKPGESGFVRITYHPENRVRQHLEITSQIETNIGGTPFGLKIIGDVRLLNHPPINYFDLSKCNKRDIIDRHPKDDFELILKRYVDSLINNTTDIKAGMNAAPYYANTMNEDGSWAYIDYNNQYVIDWEPLYHLVQLLRMAFAYTLPYSDYYGNEVLYDAIMQGLNYWYQKNPMSKNWYANQISAPDYIVRILAVMEFGVKKTDEKIKKQLLERINNSDPRTQPASGKVKLGKIHLLRGCLLKDYDLVSFSSSQLFEPIRISEKEGIQKDLSYLDHGKQLYIGGYGYYMIDGVLNAISLLDETSFGMPQDKMSLLSDYVRGTYMNTYRSCYIDYSVIGRSIAIENALLNKNRELLANLIKYDKDHAIEYRDILLRFETGDASYSRTDLNQMFPLADYMLHNRKNFDFSVRCVSTRTIHDEVANGEGLLSTYLADGATNIRVFGDEYYNIFPVWEWDKIPGTTVPEGEVNNRYVENGETGHTSFVGGTSDGNYGVMVYLMNDHGIKAHKSWFLFDEEVVCLGCGIENHTTKVVNTSVNQCHLMGDVFFISNVTRVNKKLVSTEIEKAYRGYIWHNNIAYYFPDYTNIHLKAGNQKGSWNKINYNLSSTEISIPVFNLYIEHGLENIAGSYEYYLIPGKDLKQIKKYNPQKIQILSNTESLQAVYNKKLDILQAVFYESGTLKIKGKIVTVKQPCTLIIKDIKTSNPKITITDPTQDSILSEYSDCIITK